MCGFNIAGPHSRDVLRKLTQANLSNEAMPFMRSAGVTMAGIDCLALRVSFTAT